MTHSLTSTAVRSPDVPLTRRAEKGRYPGFALGLFTLAVALVVNSLLGPLGFDAIRYPLTGTLLNQTIGLEVVTVALVVPLTVASALLAARGHRAAPFLGFGPAAYAAYMFVQYVLGPEYDGYLPQVLFHTLLVALSMGMAVWAWTLASQVQLPPLSNVRRRVYGSLLLVLAAFIATRYLPVVAGGSLPAEFDQARTFFWSIFLLDLGVVVPVTVLAGVGLLRDVRLAQLALYALLGWYALVPASVAAMSATMVIRDDPYADPAQAVLLAVVASLFAGLAAYVFLPLFRRPPEEMPDARPPKEDNAATDVGVVLWWLPVGAGGHVVKHTSGWWEALDARRTGRARQRLFHAALEIFTGGQRYVIEMAPEWGGPHKADRGVVATGPVGLRALGRSRMFRYEVRCWRDGDLPDREWAVGGPVSVTHDDATAQTLLQRVPEVPVLTWGRRVPPTADMWNSNALVSWLLAGIDVPAEALTPPGGGRAPGWQAGIALAGAGAEDNASTTPHGTPQLRPSQRCGSGHLP